MISGVSYPGIVNAELVVGQSAGNGGTLSKGP